MISGNKKVSYKEVLEYLSQEEIFRILTGYTPEIGKSNYFSILRDGDKSPGCRYEYRNGILKFIDNAGYEGKVFFNCFEAFQYRYGWSFRQVLDYLVEYIKKNQVSMIPKKRRQRIDIDFEPIIKFTYLPWTEDNTTYFRNWNITKDNLIDDGTTFLVDHYWCNTRRDTQLKLDRFGTPNENTLAYLCKDKVKLHFIKAQKGNRFFTNCTDELFNAEKLSSYLDKDIDFLGITKSKKECLFLHYPLDIPCLGLQHEAPGQELPMWIVKIIKERNIPLFTFFDNDHAGLLLAKQFSSKYGSKPIIMPEVNGSTDPTDFCSETSFVETQNFIYSKIENTYV